MNKLLNSYELHQTVWAMVKERQGKSTSLIAKEICALIESQKIAFSNTLPSKGEWRRETEKPNNFNRPLPAPYK